MTAAELYRQLTENKIDKGQFMQQIRINPTAKHLINNLMNFSDVVNVLKNKGIIRETKKPVIPQKKLLNEDCNCGTKLREEDEDSTGIDPSQASGGDGSSLDDYGVHYSHVDHGVLTPEKWDKIMDWTKNNNVDLYYELEDAQSYFFSPKQVGERGAIDLKDPEFVQYVTNILSDHGVDVNLNWDVVPNKDLNEDNPEDMSSMHSMDNYDKMWVYTIPGIKRFEKGMLTLEKRYPEAFKELCTVIEHRFHDEMEDPEHQYNPNSPLTRAVVKEVLKFLSTKNIAFNPFTFQPVSNPALNESKQVILNIDPQEYMIGLKHEMDNSATFNSDKLIAKVLKNLKKDRYYYTNLKTGSEKIEKDQNKQMVPVKKNNLVDKKNGVTKTKKTKLKESQYNPGLNNEEPNQTVKRAQQYIDSNPSIKQFSDEITFQNTSNGAALLKYGYWEPLPNGIIEKIELQFNVSPENKEDEDTGGGVCYVLSERESLGNKRDLGGSFEKFKTHLNELVQQVYTELMSEKRNELNENKKSVDTSKLGIKGGDKFTLNESLGIFKKGEKVIVESIKQAGEDIEVIFKNKEGKKDNYFFDKNDRIEL